MRTNDDGDPARWVRWARELVTMAQTGLTYSQDAYDIARYRKIRDIAVEMFASGTGVGLERLTAMFAAESGHATPKVDVRAVVMDRGNVLLVRERHDGLWSLPGGWADVGETPREAIEREVAEEAGYDVRATRLLALYDKRRHDHPPQAFFIYKVFFACEIIGGAARPSDETDAVSFVSPDALPPLSLDRVTPGQIARLAVLAADPGLPADFD